MAYDDALFQLGMDLTRSSTAQKEDLYETASGFSGSNNSRTSGRNIILDLIGAKRIVSAKSVEQAVKSAFEFAKASPSAIKVVRSPSGRSYTATASLAIGRVEIEAWPQTGYVAVDLVGCNLRPELAMTAVVDAFGAREVIVRRERSVALSARFTKAASAPVSEPARLPQRRSASAKAGKAARAA
jgi:S-adenosylmethionine decarboxylase